MKRLIIAGIGAMLLSSCAGMTLPTLPTFGTTPTPTAPAGPQPISMQCLENAALMCALQSQGSQISTGVCMANAMQVCSGGTPVAPVAPAK